jgi:hypothetical protein
MKCHNCELADGFAIDGHDERAIHLHEQCGPHDCDCDHTLLEYIEPPAIARLREMNALPPGYKRGEARKGLTKPIKPKKNRRG